MKNSSNHVKFVIQRALFNALPDALLVADGNLEVCLANKAANILFNEEAEGRFLPDLILDDEFILKSKQCLADQRNGYARIKLSRFSNKYFKANIAPVTIDEQSDMQILILIHDITHQKELEKTFNEFLTDVSHEIVTPISSIKAISETLLNETKNNSEIVDNFSHLLNSQIARLESLTTDLFTLINIQNDMNNPPQNLLDLSTILKIACNDARNSQQDKSIQIRYEQPARAFDVLGDQKQLLTAFAHLLNNAIQYSNPDSHVDISIELIHSDKGYAQISIKDYGMGISQEHLPYITDKFYRVEESRSRKNGGAGLGLSIVTQILNRHEGYMEVSSTQGVGSVFTIYLPLA